MPEGDTVFRAAQTLHRFLAGQTVTRFESVYPALTRVADDHPIVGRTIESVSARGKHLLIALFRRSGAAHAPADERQLAHLPGRASAGSGRRATCACWSAPPDACAVGFNIPSRRVADRPRARAAQQLRSLGPDLLGDSVRSRRGAPPHARARARSDRRRPARPARRRRHRQRLQVGDSVSGRTSTRSRRCGSLADADLERIVDIRGSSLRRT